jgi:hypothetical protein
MINNLKQLRDTYVYRFPTRPLTGMRVIRVETTLVGVDQNGRIYSTAVRCGTYLRFRRMPYWAATMVSIALGRLGMLAPAVDEQHKAECDARQMRDDARRALSDTEQLANLGVPLTKRQMAKLREMAGVDQ